MVCSVLEDSQEPIFGVLQEIIVTPEGQFVFAVQLFMSEYNSHLNSYELIEGQKDLTLCHPKDLLDSHVLSISSRVGDNKKYVTLKYSVF